MRYPDRQILALELRRLRIRRGLSLRETAARSQMNAATISRLETAAIDKPRPDHLLRLATTLGAEPELLYAYAGYALPQALPEVGPYLRVKYGLSDAAADRIGRMVQSLRRQGAGDDTHDAAGQSSDAGAGHEA